MNNPSDVKEKENEADQEPKVYKWAVRVELKPQSKWITVFSCDEGDAMLQAENKARNEFETEWDVRVTRIQREKFL